MSALTVCWCGRLHLPWTWHDPTHGQIDRDIQERVSANLGLPYYTSNATLRASGRAPLVGTRTAIEMTMQRDRDRGVAR